MEPNTHSFGSPSDPALAFGDLLRRHRRAAGLTQEALAERAGVSARAITALERGVNRAPRRETLRLLAGALGLSREASAQLELVARRAAPRGVEGVPHGLSARPAPSGLVGRGRERAALERHLAGEGPPVLLFAGEPGIGKTRLLHEAMKMVATTGLTLLFGGCDRRTGQDPYTPLAQALERYIRGWPPRDVRAALRGCNWLVRLLPELHEIVEAPFPLGALPPERERRLVFSAATRFLTSLSGPSGVLLVLDDLQWAGSDALALLATLVQAASSIPLRVVGAYRSTEIDARHALSALLADMLPDNLVTHLPISTLCRDEASELLQQTLLDREGIDARLCERILERADGVPLFVVSYARSLWDSAPQQPIENQLPWDLIQVVQQRITALPALSHDVLEAASVVGRAISPSLMAGALEMPEDTVLRALDGAYQAGVVEEEGGRHLFAHDVIREAVEAGLTAPRRMLLHRRIARALLELPDASRKRRAADLAWHLHHGGEDAQALPYTVLAAGQAESRLAYADAEHYYRLGATIARELGDRVSEARILQKLGGCLRVLTRYREAHVVLDQAALLFRDLDDPESEAAVVAEMGQVLGVLGRWHEGLTRVRMALSVLDRTTPSRTLVSLWLTEASLLREIERVGEALVVAERAAQVACGLQDEQLLAAAEYIRGDLLLSARRPDEALPILEAAIRLAEAIGDSETLYEALSVASGAFDHCGEYDRAKECVRRALTLAERIADPQRMGRAAWNLYWHDEWSEAREYLERTLDLCHELGEPPDSCAMHLICLGELYWAQGDLENAARLLEEGLVRAERSGTAWAALLARLVLTELDIFEDRGEPAVARLEPHRATFEQTGDLSGLALLAEAYLQAGSPLRALEIVESEFAAATNWDGGRIKGLVFALRVKGIVLGGQGRWEEAKEAFDRAVSFREELSYSWFLARTLYDYGLMYVRMGQPHEARERLEEALSLFRRLGARAYVARAEQTLARVAPTPTR